MRPLATSIVYPCMYGLYVYLYRNSMHKRTTMIPTAIAWGFTANIISFGTKYDADLEIMSCQVFYFINRSMHQDPKNNYWRVPFKIPFFARFSLVSLIIHPRSRRCAERIDQQQQQQSVASAILAKTHKQSVRNTNTLIITSRSYL